MIISKNLSLQFNYKMIISKNLSLQFNYSEKYCDICCNALFRFFLEEKYVWNSFHESRSKSVCFSGFLELGVFEIDSHLAQPVKKVCASTRARLFSHFSLGCHIGTYCTLSRRLKTTYFLQN